MIIYQSSLHEPRSRCKVRILFIHGLYQTGDKHVGTIELEHWLYALMNTLVGAV
jgi:hypothetical protein